MSEVNEHAQEIELDHLSGLYPHCLEIERQPDGSLRAKGWAPGKYMDGQPTKGLFLIAEFIIDRNGNRSER